MAAMLGTAFTFALKAAPAAPFAISLPSACLGLAFLRVISISMRYFSSNHSPHPSLAKKDIENMSPTHTILGPDTPLAIHVINLFKELNGDNPYGPPRPIYIRSAPLPSRPPLYSHLEEFSLPPAINGNSVT